MGLLIITHLMQSGHHCLLHIYHSLLRGHYLLRQFLSQIQALLYWWHLLVPLELVHHRGQVATEVETKGELREYLQKVKARLRKEVHCVQKHADFAANLIRIMSLTYTITGILQSCNA